MRPTRTLRIPALLLVFACTSGCAALVTRSRKFSFPYSGTRLDASILADSNKSWLAFAVCSLDLPLSFALDTALIPYDIAAWLWGGARGFWDDPSPIRDPDERFAITGCSVQTPGIDGWYVARQDPDAVILVKPRGTSGTAFRATAMYYREGAPQTAAAFGDRSFASDHELLEHFRKVARKTHGPQVKILRDDVVLDTVQGRQVVRRSMESERDPGQTRAPTLVAELEELFFRVPETGRPVGLQMLRVRAKITEVEALEPLATRFFSSLKFQKFVEQVR